MKYKIRLTPLDWYFFGGETTFGEGVGREYFAKSNLLPQGTALLGMLRFELLKANNLIPITSANKTNVIEVIGDNGFRYNDKNFSIKKPAIGAIKSISPLFIEYQKNELFYQTPNNYGKELKFKTVGKVSLENSENHKSIPYIEGYSSKNYTPHTWLSLKGRSVIEYDKENQTNGIFKKKTKIGITKKQVDRFDDNEDGFFKTELCGLNSDYSFVFFADIEDTKIKGNRFVYLGAERSMFNMEIEEKDDLENIENEIRNKHKKNNDYKELFFISDAFIADEILKLCKFAWFETAPFRNIIRPVDENKNYSSLSKGEKSIRFNLIKRGSVLFFDALQKEGILKQIDNIYLQNFGYNKYIINQ